MYVCKYLWNKSGLKAKVTRQTIIWRTVMVLFLELFRESGSFFYRWHFLCIKVINTPEISKTYEICKGIIFYKPSLEHALLMVWCISPVANGYEIKISENSYLFWHIDGLIGRNTRIVLKLISMVKTLYQNSLNHLRMYSFNNNTFVWYILKLKNTLIGV